MARRPAIHDAEPSVVVSHGADFFGEDRHLVCDITVLGGWLRSGIPRVSLGDAAMLVTAMEEPSDQVVFPPAYLGEWAGYLLKISRDRYLKPPLSAVARSLADSAARAAEAGDPWTWTLTHPGRNAA
ncbi:hypothetical protein [Streptomyces sp. NPDC059783]|uniref:DUF7739 domain-containing protein n=1 Tax=Streptomyces sp. NPDC059783 TaxID=3346944 RepID=UPI0036484607